ncbi:biotin-dependent carboxyltransferase [Pseudomaricurvus alkylphenolicus]|uniref:5-oxoprolinase subunit C family protein n=1 Tax=Pseudomaricurvus alkylphenolicus TaxID=1306991 RepID=UPI001420EA4E|nr:biotin-dependent carboxyltransferase family protein [Pseudomaricurvus alkylphenolicus]NIB44172.1 biotin-dependent carboxyltransferase [Pseudomaricurvus alkylphenolicus]
MIQVIKPGLETTVQDYPGRIGFRNQGFPPSGPMDSWSFRLANLLVGNESGAAALECQYMGPTLQFEQDTLIAITGADMQAKLDGEPVPLWQSVLVLAGQTLEMKFSCEGIRAYVALAGGIDSVPWLGSQATFHKAGIGGVDGHALKEGQALSLKTTDIDAATAGRTVAEHARPQLGDGKHWSIHVVLGPNDEWLDEQGIDTFLSADWKLSSKSDRTGFRLEGPELSFSEKAYNKGPEHGSEPSNIIDQGYPVGGINLAGQTPIILVNDGPSMGGFINPFTVPTSEFWKLGQAKPGAVLKFVAVTVDQAQQMARAISNTCSLDNIKTMGV